MTIFERLNDALEFYNISNRFLCIKMFSRIFGCLESKPAQTDFSESTQPKKAKSVQTKQAINSNIEKTKASSKIEAPINISESKVNEDQYFVIDPILKMNLKSLDSNKKSNVLFMTEHDTNSLNKYRMNFSCLCQNPSEERAKKDFIDLARQMIPEQEENIKQFEKTYKINLPAAEANSQALKWAFRDSFFWKMIEILPKLTTDPKKLAYLRLAFHDLHKAILENYYKLEIMPKKLYIVTSLKPEEQQKMKKNKDNFVIFSSFIRGFTKLNEANKARKAREGSILYEIIFSKLSRDKEVDFGFATNQTEGENVIFNIFNFFQVNEIDDMAQKEVTLGYASLAVASAKRKAPKRIGRTAYEQNLLRNSDYVQDLMGRVDSQADMLQVTGYFKESIEVFEKKSDFLRKTHAGQQVMDSYRLSVADSYKLSNNYSQALSEYSKIVTEKMKLIALVHIAQLYHESNNDDKFHSTVFAIEPKIQQLDKYSPPEAFKAKNYVAISLMKQGNFQSANKKFKTIMQEMSKFYNYKYESIPLVHDMVRNIATCESKMKNYSEALNLLRHTQSWQKVCEGITPNYALTETLIQQVHLQKGDVVKAKESEVEIEDIRKSLAVDQQEYIAHSRIVVNLNQSMVRIEL